MRSCWGCQHPGDAAPPARAAVRGPGSLQETGTARLRTPCTHAEKGNGDLMTQLLARASWPPRKPGAGGGCELLEYLFQRCQDGVYVLWHLV